MAPRPAGGPLEAARKLLARRDHGRAELRAKLAAKGFSTVEIEGALRRLEQDGLLDDARCAQALIARELERGHGLAFAGAKARSRGLQPHRDAESAAQEAESLKRYLRRKGVAASALTGAAERAKILRSLRGRGYTAAAVAAVLGPLAEEEVID